MTIKLQKAMISLNKYERCTFQSQALLLCVLCRVGYRSLSNRYRYRYLEFGTGTQRYLFSVLYSLCNNKNIYFSEKISPKLSISTFWTIGPYNFFFLFFFFQNFFLFSDNQMKAWNIYLLLIKWKWSPFIFWQTNRGLLLKLIHGRKIVWIYL